MILFCYYQEIIINSISNFDLLSPGGGNNSFFLSNFAIILKYLKIYVENSTSNKKITA